MKRRKYGNKFTEIDGIKFHSEAEARRYVALRVLAKAGLIQGLILQPRFPIVINGVKITTYVADFEYVENGVRVVEDVKGFKTDIYKLKRKLMLAVHNITIKET